MPTIQNQVLFTLRTPLTLALSEGLTGLGYSCIFPPEETQLSDEESLTAFAKTLKNLLAVMHPAPVLGQKPVEQFTWEERMEQKRLGPAAALCVTKVFSEFFRSQGGGIIIYLNSVHAEKPAGHGALYSMVCGATQMLCREANQEYGADHVRFYFLQLPPQPSDPDRHSPVSNYYFRPDLRAPQQHLAAPGEILGILAFLLTPAAAPLSGQDLCLDGGLTQFYTAHETREEADAWKSE